MHHLSGCLDDVAGSGARGRARDLIEGEPPAVEPAADALAHDDALGSQAIIDKAHWVHVRAVGEVPDQATRHTRTALS